MENVPELTAALAELLMSLSHLRFSSRSMIVTPPSDEDCSLGSGDVGGAQRLIGLPVSQAALDLPCLSQPMAGRDWVSSDQSEVSGSGAPTWPGAVLAMQ